MDEQDPQRVPRQTQDAQERCLMATGSEKRGTRKTGRGYRTPALSAAEKRRRQLDRRFRVVSSTRDTGGDVPF